MKVASYINFDNRQKSLTQKAKELEVRYLLSGSVQREDDRVRVFLDVKRQWIITLEMDLQRLVRD